MSVVPATDPDCTSCGSTPAITTFIEGRPRDLGGFMVRRILPSPARRNVGPFVFFDHMGPADLAPGRGIDVRPHPHIGLATVTYLFEGEIFHRDSTGAAQSIRPGDINWMIAGRGIVHSERTSADVRRAGSKLNGLQAWVALPRDKEEVEPEFHHHPVGSLPVVDLGGGAAARVLAGTAYGATSPARVLSPMFYVDITLPRGARVPLPREHQERAAYVVEGSVRCAEEEIAPGRMPIFASGVEAELIADTDTRLVLIGGAPLDAERHLYWNFVSSSEQRIEQAKQEWRDERFPKVPGDELERIPLPE